MGNKICCETEPNPDFGHVVVAPRSNHHAKIQCTWSSRQSFSLAILISGKYFKAIPMINNHLKPSAISSSPTHNSIALMMEFFMVCCKARTRSVAAMESCFIMISVTMKDNGKMT